MSKPINENLRDVRVENEAGDLIPLLDHAGEQFADLIKAIASTNKAGTLTLKVDVKPSTAGARAGSKEQNWRAGNMLCSSNDCAARNLLK